MQTICMETGDGSKVAPHDFPESARLSFPNPTKTSPSIAIEGKNKRRTRVSDCSIAGERGSPLVAARAAVTTQLVKVFHKYTMITSNGFICSASP